MIVTLLHSFNYRRQREKERVRERETILYALRASKKKIFQ